LKELNRLKKVFVTEDGEEIQLGVEPEKKEDKNVIQKDDKAKN